MAFPVHQAVGSVASGTAAITVAWPAHLIDDVAILVIETSGNSTTLTPPTGWAAITGSPVTDLANATGSKLQVWWKRATSAAEPTVSVTDSGDHQIAQIITFRGCITTGNPWNVSTTATKTVAATAISFPAITTTLAESLIVFIASRPNDSASDFFNSTITNTNLTNLILESQFGAIAGNGGGAAVYSGEKLTVGNIGTTTTSTTTALTSAYLVLALIPPTPVTGDLNTTDELDTFDATGIVREHFYGTFAATEPDSDTFNADVDILVQGTLSATDIEDTFSANGTVYIVGDLWATEQTNDIFSGSGANQIAGNLNAIELTPDSITSNGNVYISGILSTTDAQDYFTANAKLIVAGSLFDTESLDNITIDGKVILNGSLEATEDLIDDIFSANGNIISAGSLIATENTDILSATGKIYVNGSSILIESSDIFYANGKVIANGSLSVTEIGYDAFTPVFGNVYISGILSTTDNLDTFTSNGKIYISGSKSALEQQDTSSANGKVIVKGSLGLEENIDDFISIGTLPIKGNTSALETSSDIFSGVGQNQIGGILSSIESGNDTIFSNGIVRIIGTIDSSESSDTFTSIGSVILQGTLISTEDNDSANNYGTILIQGTLELFETTDTFTSNGSIYIEGSLDLIEPDDISTILGSILVKGDFRSNELPDIYVSSGVIPTEGLFSVSEYQIDFVDNYVIPNFVVDGYFQFGEYGKVRDHNIPDGVELSTTVIATCYSVHGNTAPYADLLVTLYSGTAKHGVYSGNTIYTTANSNGIAVFNIPQNPYLKFKISRYRKRPARNPIIPEFIGTSDTTLIIKAYVD